MDTLLILQTYGPSIAAIVAFIGIFIEFQRLRNDVRKERRVAVQSEEDGDRDRSKLLIEQRRLSEVNVLVQHKLQLTAASEEGSQETPFVVFRLPLQNVGDGPVDILASLTSARLLNSKNKPGIGLRSRDVEWSDYQSYYWNELTSDSLFAGISTTKNLVTSPSHFVRLASEERGTMRRIDAVNNKVALQQRAPLYIMYRVFLVARGYPLGEILRQLGGGPPEPLRNLDEHQLQFRNLAQPNYARWRKVQQAMTNLNRLSFRIATGDPDPLGHFVDPDAWRLFLLHHENFLDPQALGPQKKLEDVAEYVWQTFYSQNGERSLPPNLGQDDKYAAAREYCRAELAPMLGEWQRLLTAIDACAAYDPARGYQGSAYPGVAAGRAGYVREGYPALIHTVGYYQERWLTLMREGFLVSRPFEREENRTEEKRGTYDAQDIPEDPRVLEPFVARVHFFLDEVGKKGDVRPFDDEPEEGMQTRPQKSRPTVE